MNDRLEPIGAVEIVNVNKIRKTYEVRGETIHALREVSFSVRQGEIFALLGPNGAGKTTLVKILMNFIRPTAGQATIMGHVVTKSLARQAVGYVPEELNLPNFTNAGTMLEFLARLSNISAAETKKRISLLLQEAALADIRHAVNKFSKGMKRRLSLIQALLHKPALLILDEPTDGLDPIERQRVLKLLENFRDQGGTILLCSHILSEVETLCDRYLILNQGEVIREGSRDDFIADGYLVSLPTLLPDELRGQLPPGCSLDSSNGRSTIRIHKTQDLAQLMSWLNEWGVNVKEVIPCRSDLTNLFIENIKKSELSKKRI